jgi:hypothetical protein
MATITKRDTYIPPEQLTDGVDTRPGHYYVSVIDGPRYQLLAGPYDTHAQALAQVDKSKSIAQDLDPRSVFYGFGTCRIEITTIPRMGILNDKIGYDPQPMELIHVEVQ